mgnify:CR=1 FL=1
MPKEYRTIQEVAGPLMLVQGVENVTYDELGEIELASGEKRRCKVLKIDGEVGEKKFYDPRSWGRKAEDSMSARVVEACRQLGSAGKALK